jgi:putative IMPACT (imprinted ancient) family translation regulator
LGVGGLIHAYRTSAQLALEASDIIEKTIDIQYQLNFGYDLMNKVMRVIKERNLRITDQQLALDCQYTITVRKKEAPHVFEIFDSVYKLEIKEVN